MNEDKGYTDVNGSVCKLPGTSLTLVRNVGIHMTTKMVTNNDGSPIPEGILDAMVTSFPRPVLVLTVRFCIGVGFECVGRDLLPCQRELQLHSTNIAPPAHIPLFLWS